MLAQMLNSEVNGTSAYKIEYEELEERFEACAAAIHRGIPFASSLYEGI